MNVSQVVRREDVLEFLECVRELKWHLRRMNMDYILDTRGAYQKLLSAGVNPAKARVLVQVLSEMARTRRFDSLSLYEELAGKPGLSNKVAEVLVDLVMAALKSGPDNPFDEEKASRRLCEEKVPEHKGRTDVSIARSLSQDHEEAPVGDALSSEIASAVVGFITEVARVFKA